MKKTYLTITVDTEFSTHKDDMGIFGRINAKDYGLPLMAELLDKYNLKATFYVDVYTNKDLYVQSLIDICRELKKRGHDFQLHTHPNGLFDPNRGAMKDYSLQEQIDIIHKGKEIFKEWLGEYPVAHRAGDWGADYYTLQALKENAIYFDSSMFYGWNNCRLNYPVLTKNTCVERWGVIEMPASVFQCVGLNMFSAHRLVSTDGNSMYEVNEVCSKLNNNGLKLITTVFHSFSFLKWNKERTKYFVVNNRIKKFEDFLKMLSKSPVYEVKTVREMTEIYKSNKQAFLVQDYLPWQGIFATANRVVDRYLDKR